MDKRYVVGAVLIFLLAGWNIFRRLSAPPPPPPGRPDQYAIPPAPSSASLEEARRLAVEAERQAVLQRSRAEETILTQIVATAIEADQAAREAKVREEDRQKRLKETMGMEVQAAAEAGKTRAEQEKLDEQKRREEQEMHRRLEMARKQENARSEDEMHKIQNGIPFPKATRKRIKLPSYYGDGALDSPETPPSKPAKQSP